MSKTSKLGSDPKYKRPPITKQEQLTVEEIDQKLDGYAEVKKICDVPLNTHLRFFTKMEDGTEKFRMGGFLKRKSDCDTYVILTNGKNDWSVQVKNTRFYSKMTSNEHIQQVTEMYQKKLSEIKKKTDKKDAYIKTLHKYIYDKTKYKYPLIDEVKNLFKGETKVAVKTKVITKPKSESKTKAATKTKVATKPKSGSKIIKKSSKN